MEIRPPANDAEFAAYFALRYEVLRQPWGEPDGTEKDKFEDVAIHAAAFERGEVIGVGRLHFVNDAQGQIRYMAVRPGCSGRGVGAGILRFLEAAGVHHGLREITLNARENAVGFYQRLGYESMGEGPLLWGVIRHQRMRKLIEMEAAHG